MRSGESEVPGHLVRRTPLQEELYMLLDGREDLEVPMSRAMLTGAFLHICPRCGHTGPLVRFVGGGDEAPTPCIPLEEYRAHSS